MLFRTSYDTQEFTSRTLRFNFDDNKQTITLINSYCSKILVINYDEIISVDTIIINSITPSIEMLHIKCTDNINLYLLTGKKDYTRIDSFVNNSTPCEWSISETELGQCVLNSISNRKQNDYFILASQSQYKTNIEKINTIASIIS